MVENWININRRNNSRVISTHSYYYFKLYIIVIIIVNQTNAFKTFGRIIQVYNNGEYKVKILGTQYFNKTKMNYKEEYIIKSIHKQKQKR